MIPLTHTQPRTPPDHRTEAARMACVHRYEILDSAPDEAFDAITKLTAHLFRVPIALVTIVDTDRIWFKSHYGLQAQQLPRDPGLCASAILSDEPWIISDAATDPRSRGNPLVSGEFGLRFYAGVPLRTPDGHAIGTLCVVDFAPRTIDDEAIETLRGLASLVMTELELRVAEHERLRIVSQQRRDAEYLARSLQESLLPGALPPTPGLEVAARYHVANKEQVGGDFYDVIDTGDAVALAVGDVCGKGTEAAAMTGRARWTLRTLVLDPWTPAGALDRLNRVLVSADAVAERYCTLALAKAQVVARDRVRVTLALGGHPHPLVLRGDGTVEHAGHTAPIIGYFGDASFHDAQATLSRGDLLIMFTDGMLEAVQGHGSSEDDALRSLLSPLAGRGAHEVADRLDGALRTSALCDGSLRDDAAYLVVRAVP